MALEAGSAILLLFTITIIYYFGRTTIFGYNDVTPHITDGEFAAKQLASSPPVAMVHEKPGYVGREQLLYVGWQRLYCPAGSLRFLARKWYSVEQNRVYYIRAEVVNDVRFCPADQRSARQSKDCPPTNAPSYLSETYYIFDDVADLKRAGFNKIIYLHIYLEPDFGGQVYPYINQLQDAYKYNASLPYGDPGSFKA